MLHKENTPFSGLKIRLNRLSCVTFFEKYVLKYTFQGVVQLLDNRSRLLLTVGWRLWTYGSQIKLQSKMADGAKFVGDFYLSKSA